MKLFCFVVLIFIGFQSLPKAYAQADASICDRVLVSDFDFLNSDSTSKLDYLKSIDKETYQESKVRVQIVGSAFKNTFTGDDTYDQFNSKRDHYLENEHYASDQATRISHLRKYVPDARASIAYEAYKVCIAKLAPDQHGLYNAIEETETGALVNFYWSPPTGNRHTTAQDSHLTGGFVGGAPRGKVFKEGTPIEVNGYRPVQITRSSPTSQISGFVLVGGLSTFLKSDPKPKIIYPIYRASCSFTAAQFIPAGDYLTIKEHGTAMSVTCPQMRPTAEVVIDIRGDVDPPPGYVPAEKFWIVLNANITGAPSIQVYGAGDEPIPPSTQIGNSSEGTGNVTVPANGEVGAYLSLMKMTVGGAQTGTSIRLHKTFTIKIYEKRTLAQ